MTKSFSLSGRIVWPVRTSLVISKTHVTCGNIRYSVEINYPNAISVAVGLPAVPSISWTEVTIKWKRPFNGSRKNFISWARTPRGLSALLGEMEIVQAELIDRLYRLEKNDQEITHCIRHFGPRDWITAKIQTGQDTCYEMVGSGLLHLVSARSVNANKIISSAKQISFEERTLHRAAHLSECGYPTESLLLAFSVLDAAVGKFLMATMKTKGVAKDSAEALLRNTTTKRLSTYLDTILYLASGKSLKQEDSKLFNEMLKINDLRNKAIHNGESVSRGQAKSACLTVANVLIFLNSIEEKIVPERLSLFFTQTP